MAAKRIMIQKANGEVVPFSRARIERSLRRSGASAQLAKEVADAVVLTLDGHTTTDHVYKTAFALLKKKKALGTAARYNLKRAMMQLGPTGYPFERFVAELLKRQGMHTTVGVVLRGYCVSHEVDVLAEDGRDLYYIECKFHNQPGTVSDVKVPLYIHSRFQDLDKKAKLDGDRHRRKAWIITNTHFSEDAIAYAECSGVRMLGWRYPESGGLEALVEEIGLHPVTCLTTLNDTVKQALLHDDIVLCSELTHYREKLSSLGLSDVDQTKLFQEVDAICTSG